MGSEAQLLFQSGALVAQRYEICQPLGSGGMGWVFRASDSQLNGQSVALKFLYPHMVSDPAAFSRFRNEVLVARKLIHPSIIRTFTFETDQSHAFIVMEHVDGATLSSVLQQEFPRGMPETRVIELATDIAVGMHHSHALGIVHRDLKPDNVMLTRSGEVKLSDFGLAATLRRQGQLTRAGQLLGTPYYMAPEQFRGETFDARVDIYAFGIMLYELLLGEVPFSDTSLYSLALKHEREELRIPTDRDTSISAPLWEIVKDATRKDPNDRFQSFAQIVAALEPLCPTSRPIQLSSTTPQVEERAEQPPYRLKKLLTPKILLLDAVIILAVSVIWIRTNTSLRMHVAVPILYLEQLLQVELTPLRKLIALKLDPKRIALAEELKSSYAAMWPRLKVGDDPNAQHNRSPNGDYALHIAIKSSYIKIVRLLLSYGADPNLANHAGETPMHSAAESHDLEGAQSLLEAGANPDIIAANGLTPLLLAARSNDAPMVMLLLRSGADPSRADTTERTMLHYAAMHGEVGLIRAGVERLAARGGVTTPTQRESILRLAPPHALSAITAALEGGPPPQNARPLKEEK